VARPRHLNRGVVLLTTLLVLALLAALAWQMVGRHALLIAQYRYAFTTDQATAYALAAETFARQILYQDWSEGVPQKDTLQEIWAQPAPPFEIDNGFLEIQVRDLNGCFNLNSLAAEGEAGQRNLERLRELLRQHAVPERLADAWRDWVDADQDATGLGAEDGDYLLLDPAYRTANAPAAHVSEFRLLRDFEPAMFETLEPDLCVLPSNRLELNVNTVRPGVLAALAPGSSADQMAVVLGDARDYSDVGEVTQLIPELAGAVDALGVTSEYFEVGIRAQVDDGQVELASVLRRDPGNGRLELVSRDFSKNFRSLFAAALDGADTSR
jgi:general secretion pathway protein K